MNNRQLNSPTFAVLLAAGRGKRLRPWTDTTPKPLLPVHGRPTLDFTLQAVKLAGIKGPVLAEHIGPAVGPVQLIEVDDVGFQAFKAARKNPVDALRYE